MATQAGVPISDLSYDLTVPATVPVGPDQEAAFQQILLQSPAARYIVPNASVTGPILAGISPSSSTTAAPTRPVPFSFVDSAILAAGTARSRDRILGQIRNGYDTALGENRHVVSGLSACRVTQLPYFNAILC